MAAATTRETTRTFVEQWEQNAPLTDAQRRGFLELQAACSELPPPTQLDDDDSELLLEPVTPIPGSAFPGRRLSKFGEIDVPAVPGISQSLRQPDQPQVDGTSGSNTQKFNILGPTLSAVTFSPPPVDNKPSPPPFPQEKPAALSTPSPTVLQEPVESTQQFFDWFSRMEEEMEKGQEDVYRAYLGAMFLFRDTCDELLAEMDATSQQFQQMNDNFRFVEDKTRALQTACESLLAEQTRLASVADDVASKLAYFNELDTIAKLFNSPGEDVCLRDEFIPTLQKLDECLSYMERNLDYRDAELYLMRFRQCMTRGMTLIKIHVVQTLRTTVGDVNQRLANKGSDGTNSMSQTTLFYVVFRAAAARIKPLVNEIEKRCPAHKEYNALLNDCYNAYFGVRLQLLNPVVYARISELSSSDVLTLARSGCAYLQTVCTDEYALFYQFFSTGDDTVYGYLEKFGAILYDFLRPKIIRETKPDILSELCGTLIEHVGSEGDSAGDVQDEPPEPSFEFGYLVKVILQDAQQKLVFRVLSYIKNNIEMYNPTPADLNFTAKREGPDVPEAARSTDTAASVDPVVKGDEWYPTLQRSLHVLDLLFRHVNDAVFDDISREVVAICCRSLVSASEAIAAKQGKTNGQHFLIKHLLMLKEQTGPFAVDCTDVQKLLDSASAAVPPVGESPGRPLESAAE